MRIVVIASNVPITQQMPGSPRLYRFCHTLSHKHSLVLFYLQNSEELEQWFYADASAVAVFDEIQKYSGQKHRRWWHRQCHRFAQAPSFVTKYVSPEYFARVSSQVAEVIRVSGADLVYVDGLEMVQYLPDKCDVPIVVDLCDCLSLLLRKQSDMERSVYRKVLLKLEALSLAKYEKAVAQKASLVTVISKVDARALKRIAPKMHIEVIPHGVDAEFFKPNEEAIHKDRLVFSGVMSYEPNEDAAIFFCEEILPLIQREISEIEFWIVGKNPSERLKALADGERIVITGTVEDVRPHICAANVFVCPLRWGVGVKNKILTAMAMKKPIVATTISLDGIEVTDGAEVLIADRADVFAEKVVSLLKTPSLADSLVARAYEVVQAKYSLESTSERFERSLLNQVCSVPTIK